MRGDLIDAPDGLTTGLPESLGEADVIEDLFSSQDVPCHECCWHVLKSRQVGKLPTELFPEEDEGHLANLTLGKQVSWIIPLVAMADGTVVWDCHEVMHTGVEGQTIASSKQEEVSNLVVHELCEGEVLYSHSGHWSELVQLFKE